MKVNFDHSEPTAKDITTFWFKPEKSMRYTAGQFIELRIPHEDKDSRGDKRWFTLSSSPTDDLVSITTKFAPKDGSSFKSALKALEPGADLIMASPMGDFILPKDKAIPLVFVAGGIGCTPFHSMIKYMNSTDEERDITLLYAARSKEELAFTDEFSRLGDRFIPVIGDRLTAEKVIELGKVSDSNYVYLSGPEPMVEALENDMKKAGVNKKHIQADFFPGYSGF